MEKLEQALLKALNSATCIVGQSAV